MKKIKSLLIVVLSLLFFSTNSSAQSVELVSPESVGFSSSRLEQVDRIIDEAIAEHLMPGAVLAIVKDGKMAYLKAYGNKSVAPNIEPMRTNTIFDIASLTKPVATATATMILVEQGKLRLQDNVNLHIPDFKGWKDNNGKVIDIKVIDLLTHTSGLPAYADAEKLKRLHGAPNPDALIHYITSCDRQFEPRKEMQYSCLNYITLQRIVETLSGESLKTFSKKYIFSPLGMDDTEFKPATNKLKRVAPTAATDNAETSRGIVHDPLARIMNDGISGNAGLFSTATDLALFAATLLNGGEWNKNRILGPLTIKTMHTVPENIRQFGRSPGWDLYSDYASNKGDLLSLAAYGHTGFTGTSLTIDPENNLAIILLTNRTHPAVRGNFVRFRALVANTVAAALLQIPSGN